ncbi:MAG: hypothetical protein AB7I19_04425 [Planctomycetota bacterium]
MRPSLVVVPLYLAALVSAQDQKEHILRMRAWLDSEHTDRALLDRAATALLDASKSGFEALRAELSSVNAEDRNRRLALESLLQTTILQFIQTGLGASFRYAGQYADLRALEPHASRLLLELVIEPSDWFPSDQRGGLLPALRDILESPPADDILDRLEQMADDEDFEAEAFRYELMLAVAQWGRRKVLQKRLDVLVEIAGRRQTAEELGICRSLAQLHYDLRDYKTASTWWNQYQKGKAKLDDPLTAMDEYNIACCNALAGRIELALAAVERCAQAVRDGRNDSAAPVTGTMFDEDPDLRSIRDHERFGAARKHGFGDTAKKEAKPTNAKGKDDPRDRR